MPSFRISSFCHSGGCVGVAVGSEAVAVRSTLETDGAVLTFDAARWGAFVDGVRAG